MNWRKTNTDKNIWSSSFSNGFKDIYSRVIKCSINRDQAPITFEGTENTKNRYLNCVCNRLKSFFNYIKLCSQQKHLTSRAWSSEASLVPYLCKNISCSSMLRSFVKLTKFFDPCISDGIISANNLTDSNRWCFDINGEIKYASCDTRGWWEREGGCQYTRHDNEYLLKASRQTKSTLK